MLNLLFISLAILYVGVCTLLFVYQRSLIYFPEPRSFNGASLVILKNDGENILVSTRPLEGPRALIYFGGNAEDTSLSMATFSPGMPDRAIYLMHYRGYGGSSGSASEKALFSDALALFDLVHTTHPEVEIVGRSLGSGIAVYVASRRPVVRLVLVTPFDSMEEIAKGQYPFVPVSWILKDKFQSWRYAPQVSAPTTIIAASDDEVIPRASTELLRTRFRSGIASFRVLAGTSHNTISDNREYLPLLRGTP